MTPRDLRKSIREGRMTAVDPSIYKKMYEPPTDWSQWRRERLKVAIRAAVLFIRGTEWPEILADLTRRQMLKQESVSKARVSQYVKVGVTYLLGQGCFEKVGRRRVKK